MAIFLHIYLISTDFNACKSAEEDGVYVIHGNRGVFHDGANQEYAEPAFKAIYIAIHQVYIVLSWLYKVN